MFPRPRFSLQMLILAVGLVAALSALLHYQVAAVKTDAALEREAITWLRARSGRYSSTRQDYGVLINSLVTDAERERITCVSLSGFGLGNYTYEREVVTALSKLKHLQSIIFHVEPVKDDLSQMQDAESIGKKLRVSVWISS